jgi:hypothetical protein
MQPTAVYLLYSKNGAFYCPLDTVALASKLNTDGKGLTEVFMTLNYP